MARTVSDHRALLEREGDGFSGWGYEAPRGALIVVTYAFVERSRLPPLSSVDYGPDAVYAFSAAQRAAARAAFAAHDRASGLVFVEVSGDAMIELVGMSGSEVGGYAFVPTWAFTDVEVFIDGPPSSRFAPGSFEYETLLHEIGHATGLKHPFEGDPVLRRGLDHTDNTVMSYTERTAIERDLKRFDVAALEALYGPDYDPGALGLSWAWDAAAEALRVTGSERADRIVAQQRMAVSARGGADSIWVHEGDATVRGGAGDDRIAVFGDLGLLDAGAGADRVVLRNHAAFRNDLALAGGDGMDTIQVGRFAPFASGQPDLSLAAFSGFERLVGSPSQDFLESGWTGGALDGLGGDDWLTGLAGGDTLAGGDGADTLVGGGRGDRFVFTAAADSRAAPAARDRILDVGNADRIDLRRIDADPRAPGVQNLVFDDDGSFGQGELRWRSSGAGEIVEINLDRDAAPEMTIDVQGAPLVSANFLL